jgi:CheY-like chemotaxis protein
VSKDERLFRILCVDDNALMRQTLGQAFGTCGSDVATASTGMDALRQFQNHAGNFIAILTNMTCRT